MTNTDKQLSGKKGVFYSLYHKIINLTKENVERMVESQAKPTHWYDIRTLLGISAFLLTVVICIATIYYQDALTNNDYVQELGLFGLFIISFIATATSIVFLPGYCL